MFDDPWPEEPEDPYADPGAVAERPADGGGELPRELLRAFWGLVAVFNLGLFAAALGALLLAFRGDWAVGGGLLVGGVVSLAYGVRRYRRYRADSVGRLDTDAGGNRGG